MLQTADYARHVFTRFAELQNSARDTDAAVRARMSRRDWHAELWLDDSDSLALYLRAWKKLRASAVFGTDAQNLIRRVRTTLDG